MGAVQISHLHSGQEKKERVASVMALLPGEKETEQTGGGDRERVLRHVSDGVDKKEQEERQRRNV